jgi:putative ABC transport system ATP-binding protein
MTQTMIEANEIRMALGEGAGRVEALKGINLSLAGGELTLLMGPSGSGKTTLLSVLGCMLSPTKGTVKICGHLTEGLGAEELARLRRENVGFIFQSYHLFPTLTAYDNVRLALDVRGKRGDDASTTADEALAIVGLAHKTDAFPRELSGGEQQRVAIARALVNDPAIVFADEPTGNLDSKTGEAIMDLLLSVARERKKTLLVVTHDPHLATLGDRQLHMADGLLTEG